MHHLISKGVLGHKTWKLANIKKNEMNKYTNNNDTFNNPTTQNSQHSNINKNISHHPKPHVLQLLHVICTKKMKKKYNKWTDKVDEVPSLLEN